MRAFGILVVMPDYRNHPQGDIEDMITDISTAIEWTFQNISRYGGDTNKITLMGQSAGCNLLALTLLRQSMVESKMAQIFRPGYNELLHSEVPRLPFA